MKARWRISSPKRLMIDERTSGWRYSGRRVSGSQKYEAASATAPISGQGPEHRAPAEEPQDLPADQRRQHGRDRGAGHHQRHGARRLVALGEIAHHGPRQHDATAGRQALQEARQHQMARFHREGTADAGHDIDRETAQDDRAAAETVAGGAVEDLAEAKGKHEGREGELDVSRRAMQVDGDHRQGRQVQVDRQRRERRQQRQQRQQDGRQRRAALGRRGGYGGHLVSSSTHAISGP